METVVIVMMVLVCFSFVLKQTFHRLLPMFGTALVCALFVGLTWPWAIEQSKTQIADWLSNPALMLDTSVALCVEVMANIWYCFREGTESPLQGKPLLRKCHIRNSPFRGLGSYLLAYFNLLILPVLFFFLVEAIFACTGVPFGLIAWSFAAAVLILIPTLVHAVRWLLPEREIRFEMLFLVNVMIAILGIIATVNGRTAVVGTCSIDWNALVGIAALISAGIISGIVVNQIKKLRMSK